MVSIHYTGYIFIAASLALLAESALAVFWKRRLSILGYAGLALALAGYTLYVYSFVAQDYSLKPVYETSAPGLSLIVRIGSSWASGGSSIVLFTAILTISSLIHRLAARELGTPTLVGYNLIIALSTTLALLLGAFEKLEFQATTGMGINPLLKSLWLLPHPLTVFIAYALITTSAIAALGRHESALLHFARVGWIFMTLGNVTGGYWAYTTLGWGGYWAWDPVETSTIIPWLFLTAFFHALPLSRPIALAMLYAASSSVFLSMAVTRTGLSPLHGFAEPRDIAVWILVLLLTLFALLAVNELGKESGRTLERIVKSRSPYHIGLLASLIALLVASVTIYVTLLIPTMLSALGREASQLTLSHDRFVRVTYPILFPAFLLGSASIVLCSLREKLRLETQLALVASALVAGCVLAYESLQGGLVWAPRSSIWTNVMISLSLPLLSLALASSLLALALSVAKFNHRSLGLSLLHTSLGVLALGLVLSGSFAYNQEYFSDVQVLGLGEEIKIGDVKVRFVGYEYKIIEEHVDVLNAYAGRAAHYVIGGYWTLLLASTGWMESWGRAYVGMKQLEETGILDLEGEYDLGYGWILGPRMLEISKGNGTRTMALEADNVYVMLQRVKIDLDFGRELVNNTEVRYGVVAASITGSIWLTLRDGVEELTREKIDYLTVTHSNITLSISKNATLHVVNLTALSPVLSLADSQTIVVRDSTITITGYIVTDRKSIVPVPLVTTDEKVVEYLSLIHTQKDMWELLLRTGFAEFFSNTTNIDNLLSRVNPKLAGLTLDEIRDLTIGEVLQLGKAPPLPATLPEGIKLLLYFEVEEGSRRSTHVVEVRFDINGELQGIRGSVPKPLIIRRGLTDIYIEPYPPFHNRFVPVGDLTVFMPIAHGMLASSPSWVVLQEHQLHYLHEVFKTLDQDEKLGLAIVITLLNLNLGVPTALSNAPPDVLSEASRWLDTSTQLSQWYSIMTAPAGTIDPFFQRTFTLRVSMSILRSLTPAVFSMVELIETYDPESSALKSQGISVRVKSVPQVNLVWIGSIALIVSEAYLAFYPLLSRHRGSQKQESGGLSSLIPPAGLSSLQHPPRQLQGNN